MKRRQFLGVGAASLAAATLPAVAGQGAARTAARPFRVAIVPAASLNMDFRDRTARWFAEEGLVEGRNLALTYTVLWSIAKDREEVERRIRSIIASRPDAILVPGSPFIFRMMELTKTIPIVFYAYGLNPVRAGFVRDLRLPGANVTGTTLFSEDIMVKMWEPLLELHPRAKRLGDLWDEDDYKAESIYMPEIRELRAKAASRLRVEWEEILLPTKAGFGAVERVLGRANMDIVDAAGISGTIVPELIRWAQRSRLPATWFNPQRVREGGLVTMQPSIDEACRSAVRTVAKILRGIPPSTIPVEFPTRFDSALNLRTAKAMGLTVPRSLLLRVNEVVGE